MNAISTSPVTHDHRMMMARAMAGNQDACRRLFGAQPNLIQRVQSEQSLQIDAAMLTLTGEKQDNKQPVASKRLAKSKQTSGKVVANLSVKKSPSEGDFEEDFDARMLAVTQRAGTQRAGRG